MMRIEISDSTSQRILLVINFVNSIEICLEIKPQNMQCKKYRTSRASNPQHCLESNLASEISSKHLRMRSWNILKALISPNHITKRF